jgi:hypothetical protein
MVRASQEREEHEERQRIVQAHLTAGFAAAAMYGKLPKLQKVLDSIKPQVAQTPADQYALLRALADAQSGRPMVAQ